MPVNNRIAGFADEMAAWRQHLHANPELSLDCLETANFVVARLREFGVTEIHEGIAKSGLVAIIEGQGPGPVIGLRADMDALPMSEETGLPYASKVNGRMHACGHDGHTTMLLGAAKYLAETRRFCGRVALIFQPAEEDIGGGKIMVDEGIMDRFSIEHVYAMHNGPGFEEGNFYVQPGPVLAAADEFEVFIEGDGGHGAIPHETRDPIPAAVAMVQAIQTIVSRNHDTKEALVVSVTQIHAGTVNNVIPGEAYLNGTVRTFDEDIRDKVQERLGEIAAGVAAAHGVKARLEYRLGYPATVNDEEKAQFAAEVAAEVVGAERVGKAEPDMGAEDFSYMLEARPGAYLWLGTGPGPGLHNSRYDFNDAVAPIGASLFARLVERANPLAHSDGTDG